MHPESVSQRVLFDDHEAVRALSPHRPQTITEQAFEKFMQPVLKVCESLEAVNQAEAFAQPPVKRAVIGLLRDLRGVLSACLSRASLSGPPKLPGVLTPEGTKVGFRADYVIVISMPRRHWGLNLPRPKTPPHWALPIRVGKQKPDLNRRTYTLLFDWLFPSQAASTYSAGFGWMELSGGACSLGVCGALQNRRDFGKEVLRLLAVPQAYT